MLIVHLWTEASHDTRLRARITQALGTDAAEHSVAVAASADDIGDVVRHWVQAFEDEVKQC